MFDPSTLTWSPLANMFDDRWYGTNVTLPNDQVFTTFALNSGNNSEKYDAVLDQWIRTPNANMQTLVDEHNAHITSGGDSQWYAHIAVQPDGKVFQGGPTQTFHIFDPVGSATEQSLGKPTGDRYRMWGNAVTYDVGKLMLVGGSDQTVEPFTHISDVYLVDLNGAMPEITKGKELNYSRAFSNSVTMPNGEIMIIGGNQDGFTFIDDTSVFPCEIYNPQADTWSIVDSISIPRNYHSTAILLQDGRILSAGGGACGDGCDTNHLDGQIYSPPYLFNSDDTLATRPTLSDAPATTGAANSFTVTASADSSAPGAKISLSEQSVGMNLGYRF